MNDFDNALARRPALARIAVAIAADLEDLHHAEHSSASLTAGVLEASFEAKWTWERIWIEERVSRRRLFGDTSAVRMLIKGECARLEKTRDALHTRAKEYANLAQFALLHHQPSDSCFDI